MLALGTSAFGQSADSTATAAAPGLAEATSYYAASVGTAAHLYNGTEYIDYSRKYSVLNGNQFFEVNEERPATIIYDSFRYPNIPIRYDVLLDQVVIRQPNSPLLVKLISEKISRFTFLGHTFVRLVGSEQVNPAIQTGFYDLLVEDGDKAQVLAKRLRKVQERSTLKGIEAKFAKADRLFLRKDGNYYPVKSKSSVLSVLADKRKELNRYIQEHHSSFSADAREAAVVELVKYYNTL
ncbi:hypothetical protein [Hymenobacter persicinus]|uniref:Uncharacterized protein n=1 Tax=Hymenobacter persicinus TaxID=2025506 RepID=A0A4Q5LDD5_9BACT|nr:hypothetical protein [Hymenobacter persicinus]RYU79586.1 hypothetical protein EWM57_10490 [Hymenobacter persicinus]